MDERENYSFAVEEGNPVTLSIAYGAGNQEVIETKGALEEGDAYDLYVLIFNSKGERLYPDDGKSYFTFSKSNVGSVSVKTTTGKRYIYGVANVANSMVADMKKLLDDVGNKSELQSLPLTLNQNIIQFSSDRFPMSGFFTFGTDLNTEPQNAELLQIDDDGSGNGVIKNGAGDISEGSIKLMRLFSSIKFNFTFGERCRSFVPTTWDVINVPSTTNLYKQNSEPGKCVYFPNEKMNRYTSKTSFEFAMLENLKQGTRATDANDREDRSVAPENSTYVVLRGHYIGSGKKYDEAYENVGNPSADVEADVTYYISLGKGADQSAQDKNDYNSERNKTYTYNLNIVGIDKVITEVVETDAYHRADGDVTYTEGISQTLDAHYETLVYAFTPEDLKKGVEFQVKTPFSEGRFLKLSDATDAAIPDCWDWVYFMINDKSYNNRYSSSAKRYPGNDEKGQSLMTISQFKDYLQGNPQFLNGELKVTCFVDEYYYPRKHWSTFVNQEPRILQILCRRKEGNGSSLTDAKYIISQKSIYTIYKENADLATAWGIEWVNETGRVSQFGTTTASSWDNGRANMIDNGVGGKSWYANYNLSDYSAEFQNAYAACMSRNRDENGDGSIQENEIKWYLPAINQYMDIWMGTDGLPYGFPLYQGNGEWDHFISSTNKKIMWGEEGSSFGNANSGGDNFDPKNLRCIRNLGLNDEVTPGGKEDKPQPYYGFENNTFSFANMNEKSLRTQYIDGELDVHTHTDGFNRNLPYTAFKVSAGYVQHIYEMKETQVTVYPTGGYNVSRWGEGYFRDGTRPAGDGWIKNNNDYEWTWSWSRVYYYRWYKYETKEVNTDLGSQVKISKVKELLSKGQSPCKNYSENGDTGWRLPNQRELQMMVVKKDDLKMSSGSNNATGGPYTFSYTEFQYTRGRYFVFGGNLRLTNSGDDPLVTIRCVKDVK